MAIASQYYYNKNRHQETIKCTDARYYYLPPKCWTFLRLMPFAGFDIPAGVAVYPNPVGFSEADWPHRKPWEAG
jgi:hypothetical protein